MPSKNRTSQLEHFWETASLPAPIIIFGAGRWGKVWVEVISAARGSSQGITLVARSNKNNILDWRNSHLHLSNMTVTDCPEAELVRMKRSSHHPVSAIIASRPKDHERDLEFCLTHLIPALVEKPFTPNPKVSEELISLFRKKNLKIAIGVEFSLLPELFTLSDYMEISAGEATLIWCDPTDENRHGAHKKTHKEISLSEDILAHGISIFRLFDKAVRDSASVMLAPPASKFNVWDATENVLTSTTRISLSNGTHTYLIKASKSNDVRERKLQFIGSEGEYIELDFASSPARLFINGKIKIDEARTTSFSSTLRLELGAWLHHLTETTAFELDIDIATDLDLHIRCHQQLKNKLAKTRL